MLEEQLAFYLDKYLGRYVMGLSKEKLKISVWQGNVELTDMQLKPEALNSLKLPIKVKAGLIGSFKLKVPWNRLGKEPVVVFLDRVFILAEPTVKVESGGDDVSIQGVKSQRVQEAETKMVYARQNDQSKSEVDTSWLGSLISTIIGNLKLHISNIHIRYEDTQSNLGHPFAAGLILAKLAAVTVDEHGKETFVTGGSLDQIHKAGELQGLAFYLNSDSNPWEPGKSWQEMLPSEWSKIFEPSIGMHPDESDSPTSKASRCHYLLHPVDATAIYTKHGMADPKTAVKAQKASLDLKDVTLSLSQAQYRDILKVVENFAAFNKRLQYAHYRPAASVKEDARSWWKYACRVLNDQHKKAGGRLSWEQILRYIRMRKKYVPLYVNCLQGNPGLMTVANSKDIEELDRDLDVDTILQWRMLAHTYVDQNRAQAAANQQKKQGWSFFNWGAPDDQNKPKSLGDEDWEKINKIIGYEEGNQRSLSPGHDPRDTLQTVLDIRMRHNASKLVDDHGQNIMELSCEGLQCNVEIHTQTKKIDLRLASYKLSSPEGRLAESATQTDAISGLFTLMPSDKDIDWSLTGTAFPCYVTYMKDSISQVVDFFQSKNAVSQTLALETAAAFQSRLDEVTRNAQQQLNAAIKDKPRFFLDLKIAAPKIAIPAEFVLDGEHQTNMLLDLGFLTIQTEERSSSETEEEKDLYMHFHVGLSDVQAFIVDGKFDWKDYNCENGISSGELNCTNHAIFLPVLNKCGIVAAFQQICIPHPLYPSTKLAVRLPSLGFHFSPARYHRLMQIIDFLTSSSVSSEESICPWIPADLEGEVLIFALKGIGSREAVWQHRYAALAGPFLYILESPSSTNYKHRASLIGKKVLVVPPESIGEAQNVIAICDSGQSTMKVSEFTNAVLLRFGDEDMRDRWHLHLQGAIYRSSASAAVGGIVMSEDGAESTQNDTLQVAAASEQSYPAVQEKFFLTGALDELKIIISSSRGDVSQPSKLLMATETPLLELRALGTKVEFVMRDHDMVIGAVLQALEVQDKLMGPKIPSCTYLARSTIAVSQHNTRPKQVSGDSVDKGQDTKPNSPKAKSLRPASGSSEFFDSCEELSDQDGNISHLKRLHSVLFYDAEEYSPMDMPMLKEPPSFQRIPGLLPDLKTNVQTEPPKNTENFVKAQIILYSQDAPEYNNIDKQIMVSLATLSFFCNRPTILALLDFVTAITADIPLDSESSTLDTGTVVTQTDSSAIEQSADKHDSMPISRKDSVVKDLLGKGKDRTVLLLLFNMDKAVIILNSEDGNRLATLLQEDLHTEIKVFPASFGIKASLGNLRICDDSLDVVHPYYYICDMRNASGSSFVELEFLSFNVDDDDYQGFEYSILGKLSEVRFVYLNRFIQELSAYFMGLVPKNSDYVVKMKDKVTNVEKFFTKSEIEGSPALKLDISLMKPIIIMPRKTNSNEFLELDILQISVHNTFHWLGGGKEDLGAVHLDIITLQVEDIHMTVGMRGVSGEGIIEEAKGLSLVLKRTLRDLWHRVPAIEVFIKFEKLKAALSDKEYGVILECATSNFAETSKLPQAISEEVVEQQHPSIEIDAQLVDYVPGDGTDIQSNGNEGNDGNDGNEVPIFTTMKISVVIDSVELSLFTGRREIGLASLQVSGVWVCYNSNSVEESFVMVSLETFSVKDDRGETEPELQYMIGKADDIEFFSLHGKSAVQIEPNDVASSEDSLTTGHGSPLMMLVLDVKLSQLVQSVNLRVQQLRLSVAVDFLLAVAAFFIPSIQSVSSTGNDSDENTLDMMDGIFLNQEVYEQSSRDVRFSPAQPLVADNEKIQNYIYDGRGGCIHLLSPKGEELVSFSPDPLIIIGNGKNLKFKNVIIKNGQFLDSCIALGLGSSYTALEDDGVFLQGNESSQGESSNHKSSVDSTDQHANQQPDVPDKEMILVLQAIGSELTFHESMGNGEISKAFEKFLRARMNAYARFSLKGEDIELKAQVNSLTVEAGSGLSVLEPVDASLTFTKVSGKQHCSISLSDVYSNFSFTTIQLILRLQDDVMSFLRITSGQVIVECNQFNKIWEADILHDQKHIVAWRPHAPAGFAVLGDCITPFDEPPTKGIVAVNISIARLKRPVKFELVWSSSQTNIHHSQNNFSNAALKSGIEEELSLWMPVPPPDFVALGCVASYGKDPPPLNSALCISSKLVTSADMKDCIIINNSHMNAAFWRVDNSVSSFFAGPSLDSVVNFKAFELRHTALSNSFSTFHDKDSVQMPKTSSPTDSISEYSTLKHAQTNTDLSAGELFESVSQFKLIWKDKSLGAGKHISIWRPILPSGRGFLGDIAVEGYEPPNFAVVVSAKDNGVLVENPSDFELCGRVKRSGGNESVSFWFPLAPPGYTALGCIATCENEVARDIALSICCIRNDLVIGAHFSEILWSISQLRVSDGVFSIWPVANEAQTFIVRRGSKTPPKRMALCLADQENANASGTVVLELQVQRLGAAFYDDFGGFMVPLLSISLNGTTVFLHGREGALDCSVNFSMQAMVYNGKHDAWEPFLEPVVGSVRYTYNEYSRTHEQRESQIRVASMSNLDLNISVANTNMFVEALSNWNKLSEMMDKAKYKKESLTERRKRAGLDHKHTKSYHVLHRNKLGEDFILRSLDSTGHWRYFPLPSGDTTSVEVSTIGSTLYPSLEGIRPRSSVKMMALKICSGEFPQIDEVGDQQYMVAINVYLESRPSDSEQFKQQNTRTRCVNPKVEPSTLGMASVLWDEMFVFEIDTRELTMAEMIVKDLTRGSPIGHILLSLTELYERACSDSANFGGGKVKEWKQILPLGQNEDGVTTEFGKISYTVCFLPDEQISEDAVSEKDKCCGLKAGTIQISHASMGTWKSLPLNYTSGATCWKLCDDTIANEVIVEHKNKYLVLRSLVVISNKTNLVLDVSLHPRLLSSLDTNAGEEGNMTNSMENLTNAEEVFENERYQPIAGWGHTWPGHLLPTDPAHWSNRDLSNSFKEFPEAELPLGWEWTSNWQVDKNGAADEDGWSYMFDFRNKGWPVVENSKGPLKFVRRRRWTRSRKCVCGDGTKLTVIGALNPGESFPVPLAFLRSKSIEYFLQVRPSKERNGFEVDYEWSEPLLYKNRLSFRKHERQSNLGLHSLEECEELYSCRKGEGSSSVVDKECAWFCFEAKANDIGRDERMDPMQDWHIQILPLCKLQNFLAVSSEFTIFEKLPSGILVARDSGVVQAGEETQVFYADARRSLYMTWIPQGGWDLEPDNPILISHPYKPVAKQMDFLNKNNGRKLHVVLDHSHHGEISKQIRICNPSWMDIRKCPPLHCKFVEFIGQGQIYAGNQKLSPDLATTASVGEKIIEEITYEQSDGDFTMLSVLNTEKIGLSVALSTSENLSYGYVESLAPLKTAGGTVEIRAPASESSFYKFTVSNILCPYHSAPTQVLMIRPHTSFSNRLGQEVYIKQVGIDEPETLPPSDRRVAFPLRYTNDIDEVQVRLGNTTWSWPFSISKEGKLHIALQQENGARRFLRLDVSGYEDGSRFLVIFRQITSYGPYRLENHMQHRQIQFRQTGQDEASWQALQVHSAKPFAWENPYGEKLLELQFYNSEITAVKCTDIDTIGEHILEFDTNILPAYIHVFELHQMKVIRFFDAQFGLSKRSIAQKKDSSVATVSSVKSSLVEIFVDIGQLGVSIIDPKPQEILYLYMQNVFFAYSSSDNGGGSRMKLKLNYMQLDNQLPFTCMPVLVAPERKGISSQPVLKIKIISADEKSESLEVYPYIGIKVTKNNWRINIHEPIIWALMDFYNHLHLDSLSGASDAVQVDPEMRFDHIEISECRFKLSLETASGQRPRDILGVWSPLINIVGNTNKMPIHLRSVTDNNRYIRKSVVQTAVLNHLRWELIHNPLRLLSGVDILGNASSTLTSLGGSIAQLSNDEKFLHLRTKQDHSRHIAGVGDGFLQGTEALAQGVAFGITGVVRKPLAEAKESGVVGFFQGLGKAVLGFVVQPLSGILDFVALTVNGVGATCSRCFEFFGSAKNFGRVRAPRAIRSDGIIVPYDSKAALGQTIMQLAKARRHLGQGDIFKDPSKYAWSDFYHDHYDLPKRKIIMITSKRVMLLHCPASHDQQDLLENPSTILWEVPWENLLSVEIAGGSRDQAPSCLILHLRDLTSDFAHVVKCETSVLNQGNTQAMLICSFIKSAWSIYGPNLRALFSRFPRRHQRRIAPIPSTSSISIHLEAADAKDLKETSNKDMTGPSSHRSSELIPAQSVLTREEVFSFEEIWTSEQYDSVNCSFCSTVSSGNDIITIWRPVVSEGYVFVGDIVRVGRHPPIVCSAYQNAKDKFSQPTGFDLVWRNWKDAYLEPISIWMPIAQQGFVALGCVAVPGYFEPELNSVWCVSSSIVEMARFEEKEVWHAPNNHPWGCHLFQVACEALTFIALRPQQIDKWQPQRICEGL